MELNIEDLVGDVPIRDGVQLGFGFGDRIGLTDSGYEVGVIGATGIVGRMTVRILSERAFPIRGIHLFASDASAGQVMNTPYGTLRIRKLDPRKPPRFDFVFMAAGADTAKKWGHRLAHRGAVVIDKSSYFRSKLNIPLIVPEVNGDEVPGAPGVISNPNCTTIPLVVALKPLHDRFGLKRVVAVSFQSVSGAGREGLAALERELDDEHASPSTFVQRIAGNVIPWIGDGADGRSGEEGKIIAETRRILNLPRLSVQVTAVRTPTSVGHALAVHAEFWHAVDLSTARKAMAHFPGVIFKGESPDDLPTPLTVAGQDGVFVGRLRRDRGRKGVALWVAADNLRKGAATNAVQIAELCLLKNKAASGG